MDKLAHEGIALGEKLDLKLPTPALTGDNLDFSFSGIKTAALNYINSAAQKGEEIDPADLSASYTEAIVSAIVKQTEAALDKTGLDTLVLAGGVAANSHLRSAVAETAQKFGAKLYLPPLKLCGDNAAMIASQGYFEYLKGARGETDLNAFATKSV